MKQLTLSKPHLLILAGVPGAGKTYFAEHFAKTYNLPLVSGSYTTEILFENPNFSDDEQTIVRRLNLAELGQLLKTKNHILFDSYSESRVSRYEVRKMAASAGYKPIIIWVQTDMPSAKKRSSMDEDSFNKFIRKFTAPNEKEAHIVISGKHLPANQTRMVISKLQQI